VQENSRRHGYLLHLLGIRQLAVLVNKMDLVGYSQERFKRHRGGVSWLAHHKWGLTPSRFIPISARQGDNVAAPSQEMSWWKGPTVVGTLDEFQAAQARTDQPLRFPIQDVYRFDHRAFWRGGSRAGGSKSATGSLSHPATRPAASNHRVLERPGPRRAEAGESIGITLTDQVFVERGAVAAAESAPPYALNWFKARIFWLGKQPFVPGRSYRLKLATQEVECHIEKLERVIDASTLQTIERPATESPFAGTRLLN